MASTKQVALWPFWITENSINYFAISDQYVRNFYIFWFLFCKITPGSHFGWPKITFERISHHLMCFSKWPPAVILEVRFAPKTIGFFHYAKYAVDWWIYDTVIEATSFLRIFGEAIFFPSDAKNHKVLVIWYLNGYGEYEFDWCICDKIMACTIVGVGVRRRRNQEHNTPNIFGDIIITTLFCKQIYRYLPLYISYI